MRLPSVFAIAGVLYLGVTLSNAFARTPDGAPSLQHFDPAQVDRSLDPCADFFQYACRKWIKANPIPADQVGSGSSANLAIWNIAAVHDTLENAAAATKRSPAEQQAGDYYASCMDEAAIDKRGLTPLQPELDKIAALKSMYQLPEVLASIHQIIRPANLNFIDAQYLGVLFGLYPSPDYDDARMNLPTLDQSGMGLPGREFYLNEDDKSKELRASYLKHVRRMLELSGESKNLSETDANAILKIETGLATAAMDIVSRRDPKLQNHKLSPSQLQELTPSFNWSHYFAAMHDPSSEQYLVLDPDFFRGVEKLIATEPVDHWRAYLRYSVLRMMVPFLSQPFVDEAFDFIGRKLFGQPQLQPRWRRCSATADADLGDAVGQAYVAKYFPPENKERMVKMVKAIEQAFHQDIDAATWMAPETKRFAHAKLSVQIEKIGYPDHWREYDFEIRRDDFLGNAERSAKFEIEYRIGKFGKPVNRYDWGMTAPTVNAYEDPQSNTINFPAGILQPPFFDAGASDAVNFGGVGSIIGHEVTHGFDDQGRKFDADGNLRDWWTASDSANYDERDACIQNEYTQEVPEAGVKQNGVLSAGEDTADNGGIHLSLNALRNELELDGKALDDTEAGGMTHLQVFFLSYANVWCGDLRPEAARTAVLTQGHSLSPYRVNNVVANMPEFAHAFGCHAGQPMVRAKACRVW